MKIVCVEPLGISQEHFEELKQNYALQGHEFEYYMDRNEDAGTLAERMKDADVAVISNIKLPAAVLQQCNNLKYLSVAFTGLDHIDLAYCKDHDITVQNAAGYSTTAVSELAVGLMIDLLRQITYFDGTIRQGGGRGMFLGRELKGKTVGVVGTGAIGTATIALLRAFGCKVLAYNRSEHEEVLAMGARYVSLEQLLKESDIVTLHVPLTADTNHMIGAAQLKMMKPTALLINTARGNVCNIPEVAEALKNGVIAGAGFDVYETEPPLALDHPLLHAPNCVCLPHVAYASREAFDIRADIVFDHVQDFLQK
ncbi:MAG: NAD(P)-binding domain-containing protein [Bacteroidales bacterium]|nr:NAD(P)-binding domain-containing protein [Bacteroidales bacterium]